MGILCLSLSGMHYIMCIIMTRKRELVVLLLLAFGCIVTVNVLWLFLTVSRVGLQYVILAFPDHSLLLIRWKNTLHLLVI